MNSTSSILSFSTEVINFGEDQISKFRIFCDRRREAISCAIESVNSLLEFVERVDVNNNCYELMMQNVTLNSILKNL